MTIAMTSTMTSPMAMTYPGNRTAAKNRSGPYVKRSVYAPMTDDERRFRESVMRPSEPTEIVLREFTAYLKSKVTEE
ncbi:MAG: hypothetical protein QM537_09380 [Candidatus Symbiobacter sp.]|nr:hypothetical protein [Candidatus Symbiobacter sp.]